MDDRPIDLRALDPDEDPWREQRVVGGAMMRIREMRREPAPAWIAWLAWWRPAAGFAALVMAVSATVLATASGGGNAAPAAIAAASGVPGPVAEWMSGDALPSAAAVFAAMQGYP
jgi:hypothetical protein